MVTILLAVGSWLVSGAVTYGFMKSKIGEFDRRLMLIENAQLLLQRDLVKYQLETVKELAVLRGLRTDA